MTVHARIRAMTVAITVFVICLSLFATATLLTQPIHHGVLVSSLTFRMSKTMIVRLDRPRGVVGQVKKNGQVKKTLQADHGLSHEHPPPLDHPVMMLFAHPPDFGVLAARFPPAAGRSFSQITAHPPPCATTKAPSALDRVPAAPSLMVAFLP